MPTQLGFCSIHRIAYNRSLDAFCPQCLLAHLGNSTQLDYDASAHHPIDPTTGTPLDPFTLQPVK